MGSRAYHEQRSLELFGKKFSKVHAWLDEYYRRHPKIKLGGLHRKLRHTLEGVEHVREKWGDEAAEAAVQHIVDDMQMFDDPKADRTWIAKDTKDYVDKKYF